MQRHRNGKLTSAMKMSTKNKMVKTFEEYTAKPMKLHHVLSGDKSLDTLGEDIADFVRWEMSHPKRKKPIYDGKKFMNCLVWSFNEITEWFKDNGKVFRYPLFLVERKETISVKISLSRDVKSRRKQHDTMKLLSTYGNERASHSSSKNEDETKNHIIYLNTYHLASKKGMGILEFIKSDDFKNELKGTIGHELMHAFDNGVLPKKEKDGIKTMKRIYKKYRADFGIGKEYVTFDIYGKWNGSRFIPSKDIISDPKNLRTFYYMLLYYVTRSEMDAYLQTFVNQMIVCGSSDGYDSDIYRRYHLIKNMLDTEFAENVTNSMIDERFKKDFSIAIPELASVMRNNDISKIYHKMNDYFNSMVSKYITKLNRILYDIISMHDEKQTDEEK